MLVADSRVIVAVFIKFWSCSSIHQESWGGQWSSWLVMSVAMTVWVNCYILCLFSIIS